MESLANIMIYLKAGRLPWHRLPAGNKTHKERYQMIVKKKEETSLEELIPFNDMPSKF